MLKSLRDGLRFKTKSHPRDVVTTTDKAVEQLLISGISKVFPEHQFIAEEGTAGAAKSNVLSDAPTWIIDPIDGTMNFVHGFPHFCCSIALYVQKQCELAWIYNPMLRQSYVMQRGKGSYFNGQRVHVSGQEKLQHALVYVEWSVRRTEAGDVASTQAMHALLPKVQGIRSLGSTALNLAQLASGMCDAYFHCGPHIWDFAAGVPLVLEAGGVVLDPCGGEFDPQSRRMLAAASPELAQQLLPLVPQLFLPRDE
ncbi:inositol monophosphatase 1-like isoform X4 [Drosophila busckii]|nr:inositol monophosphatase 1-like isoform X4 [Drosophila busckii]